jgi:hypothetical protein
MPSAMSDSRNVSASSQLICSTLTVVRPIAVRPISSAPVYLKWCPHSWRHALYIRTSFLVRGSTRKPWRCVESPMPGMAMRVGPSLLDDGAWVPLSTYLTNVVAKELDTG